MMLPTLISVSVAPGSYFFCALAALATASAKSATAMDLACLKTRWCIFVLPDVLARLRHSLLAGRLLSPSIEHGDQYARSEFRCQRTLEHYVPHSGSRQP